MSVSAEDYAFLAQDLNWIKGVPALKAVISTLDGLQQFRSTDLKIIATFFRDRFDRHMKLSGTKRELSLRILSTLNMLTLRAGTALRPNGNLAQPPTDVSMWVKLPEFAAFQDPFFQPSEVLAARAFNASASMVGSTLSFQLTSALAEKVKQQATGWVEIERVDGFEAEKGQIALQLRLFNTMSMQDIPWDPSMMLAVDRRTVEIMPGPKRKCTQRARHRFRCMPTVPVDITGHVARDATGTHIIEFRPPRETGIVVLQSITKRSVIELVNQIKTEQKARKAAGKEHVVSENDEADDEIEEVNTVVSLRCPLTYCRVQTPSKGVRCRHQRCFDLQGYLQFVQQKKLWHCPICDKSAPFEELIIDWKMQEILDQVGPGVTEIEMRRDNSFTVMGANQVKAELENGTTAGSGGGNAAGGSLPESSPKNMVAKAATKSAPVVEILSSDDESPPPKAPPVHASSTAIPSAAAATATANASIAPLLPSPSAAGFISGGIAHPQPVHIQPLTAARGGGPAQGPVRLAHLPPHLPSANAQLIAQPFASTGSTTANATAATTATTNTTNTTTTATTSAPPSVAAPPPRPVVRSVVPTEVIEISSSDEEPVSSAPQEETSDASSATDMSDFAGDSDSDSSEASTSVQRSHVETADREKTRKSRLRNLNKYYEHLNKSVDSNSNSTAVSSTTSSSSSSSNSGGGSAGSWVGSGLMGPNGEYIPGITPPPKPPQSSSSSSSSSSTSAAAAAAAAAGTLLLSPAILQVSRLNNARLAAPTRASPINLSTSTPPRIDNHTRSESGSAKKTLRRGESTVRSGSSAQLPNSSPKAANGKPLTASQSPADNKRRRQPAQPLTNESNQQPDSTRPSSSSRSVTRPRRVVSDPSGSIRGSQSGSKRTSRSVSTSPRPQTRAVTAATAATAAQNDKGKRKKRKEAVVYDDEAEDEAEPAEADSPDKSIRTPVRESPRDTQFSSPYVGDPNVPRYLLFGDNEEEDDPNQLSISLSDDSVPRSPSTENTTPPFTATQQTPTQLNNKDIISTTAGVPPQLLMDSGSGSTQLPSASTTGSVPESANPSRDSNQLKRPMEMPEEPVNGKRPRIEEEAETMEIDHSAVGWIPNRLSTAFVEATHQNNPTTSNAADAMQIDPKSTVNHVEDAVEITGATTSGSNPSPRGYGLPRKSSDSSSKSRLGLESAGDSTDTDDEPQMGQPSQNRQQHSDTPHSNDSQSMSSLTDSSQVEGSKNSL